MSSQAFENVISVVHLEFIFLGESDVWLCYSWTSLYSKFQQRFLRLTLSTRLRFGLPTAAIIERKMTYLHDNLTWAVGICGAPRLGISKSCSCIIYNLWFCSLPMQNLLVYNTRITRRELWKVSFQPVLTILRQTDLLPALTGARLLQNQKGCFFFYLLLIFLAHFLAQQRLAEWQQASLMIKNPQVALVSVDFPSFLQLCHSKEERLWGGLGIGQLLNSLNS